MLEALAKMGDYVKHETQLLPGVFHFTNGVSRKDAERLLDQLEPLIGS